MKIFCNFTAASLKKKRRGKDIQGLYPENYKILFSDIKDPNKGRIDQVCEL